MTTAKMSSRPQDRISLYLKSAQSGNNKQKNGTEGLSQKFVRIAQPPVKRKLTHLPGKRPPVEKHSSTFSHIPVSQNLSSQLSQKTDIQQQKTSNKQAGSLADGPPKDLLQQLTETLSAVKNTTDNVTFGHLRATPSDAAKEIAAQKAKYLEPENQKVMKEKETAEDTRVAKEREKESAQQARNNTSTEAEQFKVDLKFDANGVPTSAPPLPPSLSLTPSRGIGLKPQDKSKQQTSTLVKALPNDLMQELKAKLAKMPNQSGDITNGSPQKQLSAIQQEIAQAKEKYRLEETNRVAAEAKEDARVAKAIAAADELAQQAGNKTSTEAELFKVDLKFDANGVPTSAPPLPPSF